MAAVATPSRGIPGVHAIHLARVVERFGVDRERLFEGLGLDEEALADPSARISVGVVEELVERGRALTGEVGIGVHLGLEMQVSSHGYLGFAAMAASTVGEAMRLAERFAPTRTDALSLRLVNEEDGASCLVVEELASLGRARDAILLALLIGIDRIGCALTGRALTGHAELALARPSYWDRFESMAGDRVRFDCPRHRLVFDRAILDVPLVMADPSALRLARTQCEQELERIGGPGVLARVRALFDRGESGYLTAPQAARSLGVSERTLKRRLGEEGTDYSTLVDEHRHTRALSLLGSTEPPVEVVAERLGYSDVANFTRAFRRWTGMTPVAYRKSRRTV